MRDTKRREEIIQLLRKAENLFFVSHNYEGALKYYDLALTLEPNDAFLWLYKGLSFHHLEMHREALDCYDTALEIKPDDPGNKLKFLIWKDDWDNRLAYLALMNKANCLISMGLIDEAGPFFNMANEIGIRSTGNNPDVIKKWMDGL